METPQRSGLRAGLSLRLEEVARLTLQNFANFRQCLEPDTFDLAGFQQADVLLCNTHSRRQLRLIF